MNNSKSILLLAFLFSPAVIAQPGTEVYLLDISRDSGIPTLSNVRNISNNEGYDNQPSFYDDSTVIFAKTRNGQTDIASYDIASKLSSWLCKTEVGSEYSPTRISESEHISAIRLDTTGLQRLYKYDIKVKDSQAIFDSLKIGYHLWYAPKIIVATVLVGGRMDLVVANPERIFNSVVHRSVGRSLHHIPDSELVSFIDQSQENSVLKSLNPVTGKTAVIKALPNKIQDMCWLDANTILIPNGKEISKLDTIDGQITLFHRFEGNEIKGISRLAVSPSGKHLALVGEE